MIFIISFWGTQYSLLLMWKGLTGPPVVRRFSLKFAPYLTYKERPWALPLAEFLAVG